MPIAFSCPVCETVYELPDKHAGKSTRCSRCRERLRVPAKSESVALERLARDRTENSESTADAEGVSASLPNQERKQPSEPTERQLEYATDLGVDIPPGVGRKALSILIDRKLAESMGVDVPDDIADDELRMIVEDAKARQPATDKQKSLLSELGVSFDPGVTRDQISLVIDAALGIRSQVKSGVWDECERLITEDVEFLDIASPEHLTHALCNKDRPVLILTLHDDEFRYDEGRPMRGTLTWNSYLTEQDVKAVLSQMTFEWAKTIDVQGYVDEFDGLPPRLELSIGELGEPSVHVRFKSIIED